MRRFITGSVPTSIFVLGLFDNVIGELNPGPDMKYLILLQAG